jgi:ubiquinone/menaquinone biosynthesis C-methylase UbiE
MRQLYDRLVVPHLVHWGMRSRRLEQLRATTVATARGRVLEIGIGSGLNFPFYGREVEEVVGIDPAKALLARAGKAGGWMPFKIRLICQSAEHLPYPDASFDCVVATWSLCSIPDVAAALAEAHRVLKPGGRFVFVEHGAADTPGLCRWQRRLTPTWRCLAGGCHLDRRPDRLLAMAGFALETLETGHLIDGPRLVTYHYRGIARR